MQPEDHRAKVENLALRINDAAIAAGLSRSTLYKLISEKKLRAVRVGGRRLILRTDLLDVLQAGA